MKKTGRAMMGSMLFAAMLLGSSAAAEAKTYRVLTNYADSNKTHMIFDTIVKRYQEEVDPDFDVEWEVITSTNNLLALRSVRKEICVFAVHLALVVAAVAEVVVYAELRFLVVILKVSITVVEAGSEGQHRS